MNNINKKHINEKSMTKEINNNHSNNNLSNNNLSNNNPFKIEGLRKNIFKHKCDILCDIIDTIRKPILDRNIQFYESIKDDFLSKEEIARINFISNKKDPLTATALLHNYSIERSMTWRETAVVLGLYYLL